LAAEIGGLWVWRLPIPLPVLKERSGLIFISWKLFVKAPSVQAHEKGRKARNPRNPH
jgi:hypothetical protein